MKIRLAPLLGLACLAIANLSPAHSQTATLPEPPPPADVPAPGPQTDAPYAPTPILPAGIVIPLYPANSPYLDQSRIHEAETYGSYNPPHLGYIVNIHNPSIEFHAANGAVNTGATVILAAGGGHNNLNVVGEGANIVPFLTANGINAAILRNRLRSDGYEPKTDGVHDAQQAIKLVRAHADHWNLDPKRIGIVGFSAGAELAASAALHYEEFDSKNDTPSNPLAKISSRPDFIGLVYPGPSPFAFGGAADIPRDAPPAFFATPGWGDWIHALWADDYFTALHHDGVPNVELHIYARGVHPGDRGQAEQAPATAGISSRDGVAFGKWQDSYLHWMSDLGFLQKPGLETLAARDIARNLDRPNRYEEMQKRIAARRAAQAEKEAAE
ncbi:hypothetical protein VDG1235_399 [Verrucomicrobiia bacterium DG1235]|nr:hypothetical protein VDG1235_399 [Verrucomicrobiae bacterium DG1235]